MALDGIGVEFSNSGEMSLLCIKLDLDSEILRENIRPRYNFESGRIKCGDLETDAHFLFATEKGKELAPTKSGSA
ncbi:MAG: hypothetical protein AABZ61_00990 [Bacteroidota bacterium]